MRKFVDVLWRALVVAAGIAVAFVIADPLSSAVAIAAIVVAGIVANRWWAVLLPLAYAFVWVTGAEVVGHRFEWDNGTLDYSDALTLFVFFGTVFVCAPLATGVAIRRAGELIANRAQPRRPRPTTRPTTG